MILETIARFLRFRNIPRGSGQPYLHRWAIRPHFDPAAKEQGSRNGDWRVYLHRFLAPDEEGHHNHPWSWSFSIVLRGSYTEEILRGWDGCDVETRTVKWLNFIPADKYHRIVALNGDVWTLFFCGPATGRSWGFWIPGRGYVHWRKRLAERLSERKEQEKCTE